jgi:hypothetical protein
LLEELRKHGVAVYRQAEVSGQAGAAHASHGRPGAPGAGE